MNLERRREPYASKNHTPYFIFLFPFLSFFVLLRTQASFKSPPSPANSSPAYSLYIYIHRGLLRPSRPGPRDSITRKPHSFEKEKKKRERMMVGSGARVSTDADTRKTIQTIKEITAGNYSEDEIHAMLLECSMNPDEAAQRLLLQGIYQSCLIPWFGFFDWIHD